MNQFFERYRALFGDVAVPRKSLAPSIWVVNPCVLKRLEREKFVFDPIPFSPNGYTAVKAPHALGATPLYLLGYYTVQEAASQFPAVVLDPQPGDFIIDMCAAPGMKTIQLATQMHNEGTIVACDIKADRLTALVNNLERCGVSCALVLNTDARKLNVMADKVLLDAPCSGNFVTDKTWLSRRKVADFRNMAQRQRELLAAGVHCLKGGGVLVYSTCSMEPEENEEVIDWALRTLPVTLERVSAPIGRSGIVNVFGTMLSPDLTKTWRMLPPETQGFFVAKLRKK
ncbi:RsmB/NOP family class I SAM-dependent RNA methyltransferase [Candidatus Woesearchaeota archaeon]|nr:RsmB/NOP family class I SAM-dependent RNA methyltransferase [Candidatus Woesearchaeota archaeon]